MAEANSTRITPADIASFEELLTRICDAIDTVHAINKETIRQIDEKALLRFVHQDLKRTGELMELRLLELGFISDEKLEGHFIDLDDARTAHKELRATSGA